ncbi:MAG: hypothetical protein GX085_01570 [Firmicutes bacterium]|nr:hypothetical protein [Bacillota bacterium]
MIHGTFLAGGEAFAVFAPNPDIPAFVVMVTLNLAAAFLPLNGQTTGEVARSYPSLFIPAGFVFAIWWMIYLLLAGFIIWQVQGLSRGKTTRQQVSFVVLKKKMERKRNTT